MATDGNEAGLLKLQDLMSSQLDNAVELIKESLPKRLDDISIDPISNTLLPVENFKLNEVDEIPAPLKSISNGDCLYNSASILICGNEHFSDLLRGMVSIELFLERKYYLRHPYIVTKQTLLPDRNIFAMCLTNSSTVNIKNTIENHILCIINESISNCNKGCWSSQIP